MKAITFNDFSELMGGGTDVVRVGTRYGLHWKNNTVGEYSQIGIASDHFKITSIKARLKEEHLISYSIPTLASSVNLCVGFRGALETRFQDNNLTAELYKGIDHYNYVPVSQYELMIGKSIECVHVSVDIDYYTNLLADSEHYTDQLRARLSDRRVCYSGPMTTGESIKRILHEVLYTSYNDNLRETFIEAKMLELIYTQLRQPHKPAGLAKQREKDLFYEIRDYLSVTFTEDHSLKSLARNFGINEFKLKQGFRTFFHTTVFSYIHSCRMKHAFHLICEESRSVNDVASIVGYAYPNHFSAAFKKEFGVIPSSLLKGRIAHDRSRYL